MPVKPIKRGSKYRVVEAATGKIATGKSGKPVDGGGHSSRSKAAAQSRAINSNSKSR